MKRTITLVIICLFTSRFGSAQTTVTFSLDSTGEDATVWSFDAANYPDEIVYDCISEVYSEISEAHKRIFLKFDLTTIDSNSALIIAKLSLYYPDTIIYPDGDYSMGNSNECVLKRVTSAWTEHTVTWINQPATTDTDQVILPESTSSMQDYPNIDVTAMVQHMVNYPSTNYGFQLRLTSESYWSQLLFASGDNPDSTKHPKLEITYGTVGIKENISNGVVNLFPNPASEILIIRSPYIIDPTQLKIFNLIGKELLSQTISGCKNEIDIHALSSGIYFLQLQTAQGSVVKKFIKE